MDICEIYRIFDTEVKLMSQKLLKMTNNKSIIPEKRIIEAANKVFLKFGVESATMQQIADEAGVSRTSLHYYFRSKNHIFDQVLNTVKGKIIPTLSRMIDADTDVLGKVEMFVNEYINLILENPMIPSFAFYEMQRNPEWIINLIKNENLNFGKIVIQIENEIAEGKIRNVKVESLCANIMGMCVFPMLSKSVFLEFKFENEDDFFEFIGDRKSEIIEVIRRWLTVP